MSVLLIAVAVPIYIFYLVAMVKFQGEIRKTREDRPAKHHTIVLGRRDQAFEQNPRISVSPRTEPQKQLKLSLPYNSSGDDVDCREEAPAEAPEVYQFESAYFGPFLIVPLRKTQARTMAGDDRHRGLFPSGA